MFICKAYELMVPDVIRISGDAQVGEAVDALRRYRISCLIITEEDTPVGILTEKDIMRVASESPDFRAIPVSECMSRTLITVNYDDNVVQCLDLMGKNRIRRIIVIDGKDRLKGIITQSDVLSLLESQFAGISRSADFLMRKNFMSVAPNMPFGAVLAKMHRTDNTFTVVSEGEKTIGILTTFEIITLLSNRTNPDMPIGSLCGDMSRRSAVIDPKTVTIHEIIRLMNARKLRHFAVFDEASTLLGFFLISDIVNSLYEHISRELNEQMKNRYENILKTLSEGLMIIDADGFIREVNDAYLSMFGVSREEIIGVHYQNPSSRITDENESSVGHGQICIEEVFYSGLPSRNNIRGFRRSDGSITWFQISSTPLFNSFLKLTEIVNVMTDVTELFSLKKKNQKILETAREGFWEVQSDSTIVNANRAIAHLLGYELEEFIGMKTYDLAHRDSVNLLVKAHERRKLGLSDSYEITLKHKNGSDVFVIISGAPRTDSYGRIDGSFAFVTDITELKITTDMLHAVNAFSHAVTQASSQDSVFELFKRHVLLLKRGDARIDEISFFRTSGAHESFEQNINHPPEKVPEQYTSICACPCTRSGDSMIAGDARDELPCPVVQYGERGGSFYCTPLIINTKTEGVIHLYSGTQFFFTDEIRSVIDSFIGLLTPVLSSIRLIDLNRKLAITDSLTGLYNRRFYDIFMNRQIALSDRHAQPLSVIMIDIDDFKSCNDTYGHDAGDAALRSLADIIGKSIRSTDIAVRYGGEEFLVIVPHADKDASFEVAERIRKTLEETPIMVSACSQVHLTVSLGIASYRKGTDSVDGLIRRADLALYQAKRTGKNKTCCVEDLT